jgi:hypothetical protein
VQSLPLLLIWLCFSLPTAPSVGQIFERPSQQNRILLPIMRKRIFLDTCRLAALFDLSLSAQ